MIKVALIKEDGTVAYITSPGSDNQYIDGEYYGPLLAKIIPFESDDVPYVTRMTYTDSDGWVDHGVSPGPWYLLLTSGWELSIENLKSDKSYSLDKRCSETIVQGFISNALGVAYNYPSKQQDQANLTASVTASLIPAIPSDWLTPFWCEKDGVWAYRLHTKEQIQEVGMDCKSHIITHLSHNAFLQEQLNAAVTLEEIESIHWD